MKLSYNEIRNITFGAVEIFESNEGIHFRKCTQKQIEAWGEIEQVLGERAAGTTGVTLDFHTNSSWVEFHVLGRKFELLINGVLAQQVLCEDELLQEGKIIHEKLPEGENRVTLVFPSHGIGGILKNITLDEGSYFYPHKFDKKILFLGDSITQGWDSTYDCMSYAYRVSELYNAERVINGIGGAVYAPSTFEKVHFNPDIVVVAYGTNDYNYYQVYDEFEKNASSYLQIIENAYRGKKIFVITPPWRFDKDNLRPIGPFERCRDTIKNESIRLGLNIVDGYELVPHMRSFYADNKHPNALGFGVYAEKLYCEMNKYL